jgi:hypothetical protein
MLGLHFERAEGSSRSDSNFECAFTPLGGTAHIFSNAFPLGLLPTLRPKPGQASSKAIIHSASAKNPIRRT